MLVFFIYRINFGYCQRSIVQIRTLHLIRNRQPLTSFCPSVLDRLPSIHCRHPFTESVLVLSLSVRWLKCSLHFPVNFGSAKINSFL